MPPNSSNLLRRFTEGLRILNGPCAGEPLVAAVSGGADSTALLVLLACMPKRSRPDVRVLHVQHGLRGPASVADEAAVKKLCARFKLTLEIARPRIAKGNGLEERARTVRLKAYRNACENAGARFLLTAHHQGDRAETLLMNLSRGSGLRGAGALRARSPLPAGGGVTILRPLIEETPQTLRAWLVRQGIGWREDASNTDTRFARNRVRHQVLPALETVWPGAAAHLAAFSLKAAQSAEWISVSADKALRARLRSGKGLDLRMFGSDPFLDEQVLRHWLLDLGLPVSDMALRRLFDLIERQKGQADLGRGLMARVEQGRLLGPQTEKPRPTLVRLKEGTQNLKNFGLRVKVEIKKYPAKIRDSKNSYYFAQQGLAEGFVLRPPKQAEKIQPFGMQGRRLLADLLAEAKIPASQRGRAAVLCAFKAPEKALAVLGLRRAEGDRAVPDCEKVWRISWKTLE